MKIGTHVGLKVIGEDRPLTVLSHVVVAEDAAPGFVRIQPVGKVGTDVGISRIATERCWLGTDRSESVMAKIGL